jgi:hypothetical protein
MRTKISLGVCLASLLFLTYLFGGTTGKIAGSIRDATTGEPLIGANVVVKGTYMGAATDADGYFFMINVPVGEYDLEVLMIGYQAMIHTGVTVNIDQTTKVEFRLTPEAIEGAVVEVVAEQELVVEKDVTSKKVTIDRKEIQSLPVRDLSELVEAQAGIIKIEGSLKGIPGFEDRGIEEIHVRGGRTAEVGYTVDGMYIENPIYGSRYSGVQLNKFASEQTDIKTGVFDAEYGDAMSAMINVVTRRMSRQRLEGNLNVETSALGFEPDRLRNYSRFSGGLSGPIPGLGNRFTFLVTGEMTNRRYRVYEFDDLVFNASDTLANRVGPGSIIPLDMSYNEFLDQHVQNVHRYDRFSGWNAFGFNEDWDVFGKIRWHISPTMRLDFTVWKVVNDFKTFNTANYFYQYYEAGRNVVRQNADRESIIWSQDISKHTYYTLRFSRFYQQMRIGVKDPETGRWLDPDEYEARGLPPNNHWHYYEDEHGRKVYFDPVTNEWTPEDWYFWDPYRGEFLAEGSDRYYHRNYAQTWEVIADITSQLSRHHQVKFGITGKQHDLFFNEIQLPWLSSPYVESYNKHPREGAVFIQDQIEYDYMTIRIGLRLDFNNPRSPFWEDPRDPNSRLIDSKTTYRWSPRIGFSHVITENATFTFGYGKFNQFPTYRNVYLNSQLDLTTFRPILGNSLLSSEEVTQYEFGLNTIIVPGLIFQVIGWSKNYSNLNSTERVPAFPRSFYVNVNTDYATSRGIDFNVRFRKRQLSGMIQYTLSRATANAADPWESYRNEYTEETQPRREFLMGYDRTHDLNFSLSYDLPRRSLFDNFIGRIISNTSYNVILIATSGAPYTPTRNRVAGPTNSEREPWYIQTNFHFRKYFQFYGMRYTFGILVFNLFDRKNTLDVYTETGKADDPGNYWRQQIERGIVSTTTFDQPYRFGPRRRIDFTLEVAF